MMSAGNGQVTVPPGFRFHPTDEELLYYYLRKKVSYEAIDLDVIKEVDLNKLEPWDFKEKCKIGSGPQNEWYFFSHKDKKYPTGSRTNRATTAGFWKATGRDKSIHLSNSQRIGMRKTLVFYTGRAPHGQKTDWIMHEYRLESNHHHHKDLQAEDGWVVCRVFKKKNHNRGYNLPLPLAVDHEDHHDYQQESLMTTQLKPSSSFGPLMMHGDEGQNINHMQLQALCDYYPLDGSMNLPRLFSPESASLITSSISMNNMECSNNNLASRRTQPTSFNSDWSILEKLLANNNNHHPIPHDHNNYQQYSEMNKSSQAMAGGAGTTSSAAGFDHGEAQIVRFSM